MADRGILFSAPMVRALIDGRKTQTRRLLSPGIASFGSASKLFWEHGYFDKAWPDQGLGSGGYLHVPCHDLIECEGCEAHGWETTTHRLYPKHRLGDRLWVREAWRTSKVADELKPSQLVGGGYSRIWYEVDRDNCDQHGRYRHARFMPRWASRISLLVTEVRVQRLCEISHEDAEAEGVLCDMSARGFVDHYAALWNSLHAKPGERWDDNPWVVATSFDVRMGNINGMTGS